MRLGPAGELLGVECIAVGTLIAERPRTDPYERISRYGSYLGCLTAKRSLGQGWRIVESVW